MLTMMAGLASLEKDLIAERRRASIKRAQSEGKHCCGPIKATVEQELLAQGLAPAAIQERLAISKASFYRPRTFLATTLMFEDSGYCRSDGWKT